MTLGQAVEDWLAAKHGLKASTLHGHRVNMAAAVDDLVTALRAAGLSSPTGKVRKPWAPSSINYMLGLLTAALKDQMRQRHVV